MNSLFIALLFRDIIFMIDLVWGFFRDRALITIKEREVNRLNKEKEELKKIEELKTIFFQQCLPRAQNTAYVAFRPTGKCIAK